MDILESSLDAEDLRLRQSAAVHILKAVGLYGVDLKPTGATLAFALKEDWERAERMATLFKGLS